ncbi:MAG: hypothetical protein WC810_25895, partial [Janthinobacterium sp.]
WAMDIRLVKYMNENYSHCKRQWRLATIPDCLRMGQVLRAGRMRCGAGNEKTRRCTGGRGGFFILQILGGDRWT